MEIKTKYNIGDIIYRVDWSYNIVKVEINKIIIYSDGIVYYSSTETHTEYEHLNNLFSTRAEAEEEAIKRFTKRIKNLTNKL